MADSDSIPIAESVPGVDQPLRLAEFKTALAPLEPMLRGDEAAFRSAIAMVFDGMRGPLGAAETVRIEVLRRPDPAVVLGIWDAVLTAPVAVLEDMVDAIVGGVRLPYLSLHGIDPGAAYAGWLQQAIPVATLEVWPEHGHYPHLVDPDRFVQRIGAFAAGL